MNDVPDLEHDECDSLTIDFEEKKGVLVWKDEAGSRNCDDVVTAVNQLIYNYVVSNWNDRPIMGRSEA